jgi:hypothetical protein
LPSPPGSRKPPTSRARGKRTETSEGRKHTQDTAIGSYRDAEGDRHELLVRETADGRWLVLDLTGEGARVIEALAGEEDGRPQAEAIARDYLTTVEHVSAGRTARDPISEQGGADDSTHHRPRQRQRASRARGTALPRAAR